MLLIAIEPPNAARLPTPPSEAPPTPQRSYQNVNHVAAALQKRVRDDEKWERERIRKRQKRQQGTSATADTSPAPLPIPEPLTKKAQAAAKKQNQSDTVVFGKANETANLALGGLGGKKKKYAWMTGGGGGGGGLGSGAATPRMNPTAGESGTATPAAQQQDKGLHGRKRTFGLNIEEMDIGAKIQVRDLVHVLENDGKEKKTLTLILARLKNTEKDEKKADFDRKLPAAAGR